jgi:hypothetical protein
VLETAQLLEAVRVDPARAVFHRAQAIDHGARRHDFARFLLLRLL